MGSTIYSQKLRHPVYVSYTCEHCGQYNSFTQEITGEGSAEVRFGTGNKRAQQKISKIGPQAQNNLTRNIARTQAKVAKGNYHWLKLHKCTKCKHPQSWQTGRIIRNAISYFAFDFFILFIFFVWFTDASTADKTSVGALFAYAFVIAVVAIPLVSLILNLRMMEKGKRQKPDISI